MINKQSLGVNNLITQSNKLIESKYNLNITEQRLILAMISMISPEDEDFREYNIRVSELSRVLNLKDKNIYSAVKEITKNILGKVIQIKKPKGILQVNWISSASYDDDSGIVTLKFDPNLKPYLLNIKENYTSTKFGITAKFKSFNTSRIYMLAKQYQKIGERTVLITFLKDLFPQYDSYKDIKRRILTAAHKEICENSDIIFKIKENKIGRKVKEVIFYDIRSQPYSQELPLFLPPIKTSETIPEIINRKYSVDLNVANALVEEVLKNDKNADFKTIFKYIDSIIMRGNIKNIAGFVVNCFKDRYYQEKESEKSNDGFVVQIKPEKEIIIDNDNELFQEVINILERENIELYKKWFSKLNFIENTNNILILAVETKFLRDWIQREYVEGFISPVVKSIDNTIEKVKIISIT